MAKIDNNQTYQFMEFFKSLNKEEQLCIKKSFDVFFDYNFDYTLSQNNEINFLIFLFGNFYNDYYFIHIDKHKHFLIESIQEWNDNKIKFLLTEEYSSRFKIKKTKTLIYLDFYYSTLEIFLYSNNITKNDIRKNILNFN